MTHIELIINAIDYIESKLNEHISVDNVARTVHCSLYHFSRLFNRYTHYTPYDYIMRRRLAESARELLFSKKKIIDIALDYCFNSPETFSRTFKKVFGIQPNRWRKQGEAQARFLMPRLTQDHIIQLHKGAYLTPAIREQKTLLLIGLMSLISTDESEVDLLHKLLVRELSKAGYSTQSVHYYAVVSYPQEVQNQKSCYFVGIVSENSELVSESLVAKKIPAAPFIRFVHKGAFASRQLSLDYIYHTWLPKTEKINPPRLELYDLGNRLDLLNDKENELGIYILL